MPPEPSRSTEPAEPWHAMAPDEVLARFATGSDGLTVEEAGRRRSTHGPNRLPEAAARSPLARLLAQFNSLLIWVLMAAAALAAFIGHVVDSLVILAVVVLNAVIGFIQEGRAEEALAALAPTLALTGRGSWPSDGHLAMGALTDRGGGRDGNAVDQNPGAGRLVATLSGPFPPALTGPLMATTSPSAARVCTWKCTGSSPWP